MHQMLAAPLIFLLMTPTAGFAQIRSTSDARDRTIGLAVTQQSTGTIGEALNRESVRLAALPSAVRAQQPRERSWPGRHPVLFGALVGLGVGLGVESAVIPGESGGEPHSVYLPIFGGIGAGIGSLVGVIVSAARR